MRRGRRPGRAGVLGRVRQVPVPLAADVDAARALSLVERPDRFPGVAVSSVPVRTYPRPAGAQAAQVLGYLGRATAEDLAADPTLHPDDLVGRAGLEQQYDRELRGTPGDRRVGRRPWPRDRGGVAGRPVPGRDLVTSLDATVQARAEKALATEMRRARGRGWPADSGAVVVVDPRSGAVAALASCRRTTPTCGPRHLVRRLPAPHRPRGGDAHAVPRHRRGLRPGEHDEARVGRRGRRDGRSLRATYDCPAVYRIGNRDFKKRRQRAAGPHQPGDGGRDLLRHRLLPARARRVAAQGGPDAPATTPDPFASTAQGLGLGRATGVDLPSESAGRVPDRTWRRAQWEQQKDELCRRARTGYPEVADRERRRFLTEVARENCATGWQLRAGDAANFAIGQGDVLATPLQMAVVYGAIADGGTVRTPRVGGGPRRPVSGERTAIDPARPTGRR